MALKKNVEYVQIDQPVVIRRNILETAVESANSLKFFEDYKEIKSKKVSQIKKIRTLLRKINREMLAFEKLLPEVKEEKIEEPKGKLDGAKEEKTKKTEGLDAEIDKIKSKLSSLGI